MDKILKIIFHSSILFLIIFSLYPGNIFGLLIYGDSSINPTLFSISFAGYIEHFIAYFFISIIGLITYLRDDKFIKVIYVLLLLSVLFEVLQTLIPNRQFEIYDIVANTLAIALAYSIVKIYLLFSKI